MATQLQAPPRPTLMENAQSLMQAGGNVLASRTTAKGEAANAAAAEAMARSEAANAMRLQEMLSAQTQQTASAGTPKWIIPAILGVVGIGVLLFIMRKKKG